MMEANKYENKPPNSIMSGDYSSFTKNDTNKQKDKSLIKPSTALIPKVSEDITETWVGSPEMELSTSHKDQFTLEPIDLNLNRTLLTARWPPYVVAAWMALLLLSHALYGTLSLLAALLPHLRQVCHKCRECTEECWRREGACVRGAVCVCVTVVAHVVWGGVVSLHGLLWWATRPLDTHSHHHDQQDQHASNCQ